MSDSCRSKHPLCVKREHDAYIRGGGCDFVGRRVRRVDLIAALAAMFFTDREGVASKDLPPGSSLVGVAMVGEMVSFFFENPGFDVVESEIPRQPFFMNPR